MCGMCTPHCPTYHIYQQEMESPRGRITLMQALDKGTIQPTEKVIDHLNHCLGCLACERICPSGVPFGKLMDAARQRFHAKKHRPLHNWLLKLSQGKQGLDYYQRALLALNNSGLIRLLPQSSVARRLAEQAQTHRIEPFYAAQSEKKGSVGIFKGCLGQTFDGDTLLASIQLLTHLGFDVYLPELQRCCGALHQHNGDMHSAAKLALQNRQQFDAYPIDTVLYTATGCGSQIANSGFSVPAVDMVSFILQRLASQPLAFKPLHKQVLVHQACRGKNELGLTAVNQQLIQYIADIRISHFQQAELCCGAGGGNQLDYPELANALLATKLTELNAMQPDYLLSDNAGCSLHFRAGLKLSKLNIEVIHPVTLLARQLI
jgi:glycolate oxidase iron-sulfur subunit